MRLRRRRLPDRINLQVLLADDRTVFTRVGGLLQVAHVVGPDLESSSDAVIDSHHAMLTRLQSRLHSGWTVLWDQWRWHLPANLPLCDFGGVRAAQLADASQRRLFGGEPARTFDNSLFVSMHYEPDNARRGGLFDFLSGDEESFSRSAIVRRFRDEIGKFWGELSRIMPVVDVLEGPGLGSYLSQTINYEPWPAYLPVGEINEGLGSSHWLSRGRDLADRSRGRAPKINRNYLRTVELFSLGALTADTVRMLHNLPFEARWTVRIDTVSKHEQSAGLKRMAVEFEQRRQSIVRRTLQHYTRRQEGDTNPAAAAQMQEVERLKLAIELGDSEGFAPMTLNVHVWDEDPEIAEQRATDVELELKIRGFRAERARLSSVLSLLADIPGNDPQPREVPAPFSQICRVAPVTGVVRGADRDWLWDGPALMLAQSERGVPIRFAWHAPGEDLGNTALIGQSGSGKSALAAYMLLASLKYRDARIIVFDVGCAHMPWVLCAGGDFKRIGDGAPVVQPLRHVDQPARLQLARDWLGRCLEHQGVSLTHETDHALSSALKLVAAMEPDERTMTALVDRISESIAVRDAMSAFTARDGVWGETFDGVVSSYGSSRVIGIECGMVRKAAYLPLLISAIFDSVHYERFAPGAANLIMFDELHELLKHPTFETEIDRIAREIRKHDGVMVLATQHPADVQSSVSAAVLRAQCKNLILGPDRDVQEENTARFYRDLGLSEVQVQQLAQGHQKADYYVKTSQYAQMLSMVLTDEARDICGRTRPLDIQMCQQLLAEGVRPAEAFLARWQEHCLTTDQRRLEAAE